MKTVAERLASLIERGRKIHQRHGPVVKICGLSFDYRSRVEILEGWERLLNEEIGGRELKAGIYTVAANAYLQSVIRESSCSPYRFDIRTLKPFGVTRFYRN